MKFKLPQIPVRGQIKEPDFNPPGVTPAWLVRSVNAVAWVFVAILVSTVFLRSLDIARDKAVPLEITHAGTWAGAFAFYFPLFLPLVLAAVALPWTGKIIIPAFCSFSWKEPRHRWPKFWCGMIVVMLACVTMTSGFPLYHDAYNQRFKQEAVKLEQVDMKRAQLQANVESISQDLKDLTAGNTYQAQAAKSGEAAWAERIKEAEALKDPQLAMIRKAMGDAKRGDELRKNRGAAYAELAVAPTKAAALEQVKGSNSYGTDAVMDFINAWWGFAFFAVIELCALIAGWIAYMLEMLRTRQLTEYEESQPKDEVPGDTLAITDQTDQWQPVPNETTYDEDGNELIKVRRKKDEYWRRKTPKKPKKDDPRAPQMFDASAEGEQNPQSEVSDEQQSELVAPSEEAQRMDDESNMSSAETAAQIDAETLGISGDQQHSVQDLTHAEEDQQAEEPVDEALSGGEEDAQAEDAERNPLGFDDAGREAIRDGDAEQAICEQAEPLFSDPIAGEWTGEDVQSDEPVSPDVEETSVTAHIMSDEEIADLERQWAARRGLPAPTEAAE